MFQFKRISKGIKSFIIRFKLDVKLEARFLISLMEKNHRKKLLATLWQEMRRGRGFYNEESFY